MSTDDNSTELLHPDELNKERYVIGTVATELTVHEMRMIGVFLKSLEGAPLSQEQEWVYTLMIGIYTKLYNRFTVRNGKVKRST